MKIIFNRFIPGKSKVCINLFGALFVNEEAKLSERARRHEEVRTAQMKELWYIPYYILYVLFFLYYTAMLFSFKMAKEYNPFELEALSAYGDKDYLKHRNKFEWVHYVVSPFELIN